MRKEVRQIIKAEQYAIRMTRESEPGKRANEQYLVFFCCSHTHRRIPQKPWADYYCRLRTAFTPLTLDRGTANVLTQLSGAQITIQHACCCCCCCYFCCWHCGANWTMNERNKVNSSNWNINVCVCVCRQQKRRRRLTQAAAWRAFAYVFVVAKRAVGSHWQQSNT